MITGHIDEWLMMICLDKTNTCPRDLRFSVIIWRFLDGISGHNHPKCSSYSLNIHGHVPIYNMFETKYMVPYDWFTLIVSHSHTLTHMLWTNPMLCQLHYCNSKSTEQDVKHRYSTPLIVHCIYRPKISHLIVWCHSIYLSRYWPCICN